MKLFKRMIRMQRDEGLMLMAILVASLVGLLGTAVFLNWMETLDNTMLGIRPFFISLTATLIYSLVMGAIVYLLHPQKGLLLVVKRNR